jgi:DNA transformation protein and related proteins
MPARNAYVEFLIEQFEPLGGITSRPMFGGYCLYCDGTVFALVANNALYLKADDENRDRFLARGMKAFKPFEDRDEVMSYYEAPAEIFENPDAMKEWVGGSISAGQRASRSRRPRARKQ